MRDGAQCAALAVSAAFDAVHRLASSGAPPLEWADNAVNSAHNAVRMAYGGAGGTTLVLLLVTENKGVYWASVGDSRLYVSTEDTLVQISTDDTIAGQLGRPAGADIDQGKLLQYIGMEGPLEFEVSKLFCAPDNNMAILTTDGVHFLASGSDVMSLVVRHAPDIGATARRLTELARWAGGPDNATVAVVSFNVALYESPPAYACLDIWDPFGEIRMPLIVRENQRVVARGAVSKRPQTARNEAPTEDLVAAEQPVAADEKVPSKTKGGKGKERKRKPRAQRGGSVPQVQLEFSNKKS
ncbi:hypothetical protein GCM10009105_10660 [Dokdonella soli]|uniref:PPM-type phosphatase domain-containing protein n=2 Tax=Dokdonella soli TaxID=529810 RepID=A0ABN1IE09_9GAMM